MKSEATFWTLSEVEQLTHPKLRDHLNAGGMPEKLFLSLESAIQYAVDDADYADCAVLRWEWQGALSLSDWRAGLKEWFPVYEGHVSSITGDFHSGVTIEALEQLGLPVWAEENCD